MDQTISAHLEVLAVAKVVIWLAAVAVLAVWEEMDKVT
jgi:hypothetical protein